MRYRKMVSFPTSPI